MILDTYQIQVVYQTKGEIEMSCFEAKVNLRGKDYMVTNVFMTDIKYVMPNDTFIPLPDEIALRIKNEVAQGKQVTVPKKLIDEKKNLTLDDFEITSSHDEFGDQKRAFKAKANAKATAYTAMLSALDLYDFFILMTKLSSMGYNVLDEEKKEEVYLDIINTGKEELIDDLERFLEAKDKFDKISRFYNGLREYFREIDACVEPEELETVAREYNGWLSE